MGWAKLDGDAALITVQTNKQIKWNGAAHFVLGIPTAVELFYNDETDRLGLRKVAYDGDTDAAPVRFTEDWEYCIDADTHLDNAGVSIAEEVESAPQGPTSAGLDSIYGGIYWVQLP